MLRTILQGESRPSDRDRILPCMNDIDAIPATPQWLVDAMSAFSRAWFRFELRGAERMPEGPVIVAGNHSAIGIADVLCLAPAAHRGVLGERRMVGMMHDIFIRMPIVGWVARRLGAVRAHPDHARAALDRGMDVVCFPGGGFDSSRPFTRARSVELGSHRGYVRLALEKNVPVVPMATIGSAYTYLLMPGTDGLARLLRTRAWARNERLPIPLSALPALATIAAVGITSPIALLALLFVIVPNPVRITTEILDPIDVSALTAHIADPHARLEAAHALVLERLSRAVATMSHSAPRSQEISREHARELVDEALPRLGRERLA